ncbi:MAG: D-tyrosyl-tRNA(Tyr) deacylase [Planctomycetes bacterium HGW-Planctomycetes-1]|nr:MAG: D-tyrosyl-tRNA(Tyr) deacylase [Planctomycetes bacterium HGW-Planctomycetes-1]
MRAIVQRVKSAKVSVDGKTAGQIGAGLLVYLGVGKEDNESDAAFIADKIVNLRVFADGNDKMNLSVKDVSGQLLIVSNFTLFGDCRKGRRPGFDLAAEPTIAEKLYEKTVELMKAESIDVQKGIFAVCMEVESVNDGPVNFLLDSKRTF